MMTLMENKTTSLVRRAALFLRHLKDLVGDRSNDLVECGEISILWQGSKGPDKADAGVAMHHPLEHLINNVMAKFPRFVSSRGSSVFMVRLQGFDETAEEFCQPGVGGLVLVNSELSSTTLFGQILI